MKSQVETKASFLQRQNKELTETQDKINWYEREIRQQKERNERMQREADMLSSDSGFEEEEEEAAGSAAKK